MQIQLRQPSITTSLSAELPALLDRLYRNRGVTDLDQVSVSTSQLIHYDKLHNSSLASTILAQAMQANKKICIIGDFDADGATSTAICMLAFEMFAYSNIDYLVPNRFDFGYGLSPEIVELAYQQGAQVLITVDNGIACLAGVERAKSLGLTVVITDHHLPGEHLPAADVIVNPNQPSCNFESKNLAGVGVAFYVMLALKATLARLDWFSNKQITAPNLASLLDIVAIGTVADVVPLDRNNRILVHQGLQRIRSGKTRPGIKALLEIAQRDKHRISAVDLGFVIGPRLNAAGRLEDMSLGIECLICTNAQAARSIALQLDELNQARKTIETGMQEQAQVVLSKLSMQAQELPSGLVLYDEDYHQGVIGIVAGRIKEKHNRPTIVFAKDSGGLIKGSARSINGVHVRDLLENINSQNPGIITKFGGHAMAAGLTIEHSNLVSFKQAFEKAAKALMAHLPKQACVFSDGELSSSDINLQNAELLKLHIPWGQQFEEPMFDGIFNIRSQKIVGEKHLKMVVSSKSQEFDAIAFNVDVNLWPNVQLNKVRLVYKLDVNVFRGNVSVQLLVDHLEPA